MKTETFLKKMSAIATAVILVVAVSACAHHAVTEGQDYGQVRTEASATTQSTSSDQVVGTAPAPANAQNVEGTTTPAVISGPAKVDNSGRAYTSSSVGAAGNSSATGLNTNVNIIPEKSTANVSVTQSPAVTETQTTETTVATTTPAPIVTETPAPAPIVTETPTPAPIVTETQTTTTESVPMTSSTTQETTTQSTTTESTTTHR